VPPTIGPNFLLTSEPVPNHRLERAVTSQRFGASPRHGAAGAAGGAGRCAPNGRVRPARGIVARSPDGGVQGGSKP
jgi:hypothetical protein